MWWRRLAAAWLIVPAGCAVLTGERVEPGIAQRATPALAAEVDALVRAMSPAEKVGQLLMIGVDDTTATPETADALARYHVGGVILFRKNARAPGQVAALTNALQRASVASGARVPLLVATDQEGGGVSHIPVVTAFPDAMALAAAGSEALVERVARANGEELRALGINVNLAPVLDVNSNPDNPVIGVRSFGDDPDRVARLGRAYIRGLHAAGVIATAKHFPGHGDTEADTHVAAARVELSRAALERTHLVPFQAAVRGGIDMIMPAHLTVPALSGADGVPVTFSRAALTGELRDRMGFRGVVITDSLQMAAALQEPFAEGCVRAIKAGADVLLIPGEVPGPDPARTVDPAARTRAGTAYDALLASLSAGGPDALRMDEVDAAVTRILRLKKGLHADFSLAAWTVDERGAERLTNTPAARALARDAAARGLAWLAPLPDASRRAALDSARLLVLSPVPRPDPDEAEPGAPPDAFGDALARARGGRPTVVVAAPFDRGRRPADVDDAALLARLTTEAARADAVVAGLARPEHLRLLEAIQRAARPATPIVVVQFGSPYPAAAIRAPVSAILATFSLQPDAFAAAADALTGRAPVGGTPPVRVRLDVAPERR